MVRMHWKRSLVTALLWGGVAGAQPPALSPPPDAGNPSIVTLKEAGKPDQRCRILKTRRTADGKTEYQLQDLATGEIATIIESGTPTAAPGMSPSQPPGPTAPMPMPVGPNRLTSSPGPLPMSPLPTRTEPGRFGTVSEMAPGAQVTPESEPSPGLLQRMRRLFGRQEAGESVPVVPHRRFLGGFSSSSRPADDTPSPTGVLGTAPTGMTSPTPARMELVSPPPAPVPANRGASLSAPPSGLSQTAATTPYGNLEPVKLTGVQAVLTLTLPGQTPAMTQREALGILRDSPYPSQRELAVESLAKTDWHTDPNVIPILIQTASEDAAPTVRAACVRCLVAMGANTGPVQETLQKMKADPDSRVRREANAALLTLTGK